jgi:hypothetical protein
VSSRLASSWEALSIKDQQDPNKVDYTNINFYIYFIWIAQSPHGYATLRVSEKIILFSSTMKIKLFSIKISLKFLSFFIKIKK